MTDLGEWNKETYNIQYKKKLNEIEKERLNLQKIIIKKKEIENEIEKCDIQIKEKENFINLLKRESNWLEEKNRKIIKNEN
ncbi:MAG: hypothetical protein ACTSR2_02530 [Candidatus Hodarchaeales archaeon]